MIIKTPYLIINRLLIYKNNHIAYDEIFHYGINIIRGKNSSGKSTISEFINFILGSDITSWKTEASQCDTVIAELEVNESIITIKRYISNKSKQPLLIYWGNFIDSQNVNDTKWEIYPFSRSENKESFSQLFFKILGIPEISSDLDRNLTFHQILRLLYIDQLSPLDSLIKTEDFDSPLIRESISEILFGIFDNSIYNDEIIIRDKQKELDILKSEYRTLLLLIKESGSETDKEKLKILIEEKYNNIKNIDIELSKIEDNLNNIIDKKLFKEYENIKNELQKSKKTFSELSDEITQLTYDISDSDYFIKNLKYRRSSLIYSKTTRELLGSLPLNYCPNCLTTIKQTTENKDNICFLCKEELDKNNFLYQPLKMLNELELQVKESEKLKCEKEDKLKLLKSNYQLFKQQYEFNQRKYDSYINNVFTSKNKIKDELLLKKGNIEMEINYLHKQYNLINRLEEQSKIIQKVEKDISTLKINLEKNRLNQLEKKEKAYTTIQNFSLIILKSDLMREKLFKESDNINFDFKRNSFSLENKNNFSASSTVYLKNSIRFGIFFASLQLDFFRYPRFIICDNTEDKGMEEIRSQNFQKSIIDLSEKSKVKHQIIITTSMINKDYNDKKYCVGDYYNEENKSLKV